MNLLIDKPPTSIIDINGTLYFDTDEMSYEDSLFKGECPTFAFNCDFMSIIDIFTMFEMAELPDSIKAQCAMEMFYVDDIPGDIEQAYLKAMEFMNCEKNKDKTQEDADRETARQNKYGKLYSWVQDGNAIYGSINYSHNDVLAKNPDLHFWDFYNKFMNLKEDCKFNEIISNRLAHKLKKATKEQKEARRDFPETYVLKSERKVDNEAVKRMKELERMLNNSQ